MPDADPEGEPLINNWQTFVEAGRTFFDANWTCPAYQLIKSLDELYRVADAQAPFPEPDREVDDFVHMCFLICHRALLAAATVAGSRHPEDGPGITRRALEAAQVVLAIKLDPDNFNVWKAGAASENVRKQRWQLRSEGKAPTGKDTRTHRPREVFFTNALMGLKPGSAVGSMPAIPGYHDECQAFLNSQIEIVKPSLIVALGQKAFSRVSRLSPAIRTVTLLHPSARELKPLATRRELIEREGNLLSLAYTSFQRTLDEYSKIPASTKSCFVRSSSSNIDERWPTSEALSIQSVERLFPKPRKGADICGLPRTASMTFQILLNTDDPAHAEIERELKRQ